MTDAEAGSGADAGIAAVKADFTHIYNRPDPREYYRVLHGLDYRLSAAAQRVFGRLVRRHEQRTGRRPAVLDLACSYGVNAALLKHEVTFDELAARYRAAELRELAPADLAAADRAFFASKRRPGAPRVDGLDVSPAAVEYAVGTGLLDAGAVEDLEADEPTPRLRALCERADLVTVSGGIGYLTEATIGRVLRSASSRPWFAAFCLRVVPFGAIAAALTGLGYRVWSPDVTFRQRRFAGPDEEAGALRTLRRLGLAADPEEADGYWHANVYLAVAEDTAEAELRALAEHAVA